MNFRVRESNAWGREVFSVVDTSINQVVCRCDTVTYAEIIADHLNDHYDPQTVRRTTA